MRDIYFASNERKYFLIFDRVVNMKHLAKRVNRRSQMMQISDVFGLLALFLHRQNFLMMHTVKVDHTLVER